MFFCCFILIFRNRSRKKGGWNLDERVISTVEKEVEILPTFTSLVSYGFFYDLKKKNGVKQLLPQFVMGVLIVALICTVMKQFEMISRLFRCELVSWFYYTELDVYVIKSYFLAELHQSCACHWFR